MSTSESRETETRIRILDAAETLFSEKGFRNVSLREITGAARANTAAVNYHFGSKDALVAEVLGRVISPINRERLRLLDETEERHGEGPVPVEEILECLHRPVVERIHESPHRSPVYLKLAGRCLAEPEENFSETMVSLFQEVITRFMKAVRDSLPEIDEKSLFWRMHFSVGTMVYALTHGDRVAAFSNGRISATEPEEILERLIEFTAAGLRAEVKAATEDAARPDNPAETTEPVSGEESASSTKSPRRRTAAALGIAALLVLPSCESLSPPDAKAHTSLQAPGQWIAGRTYRPTHCPDTDWVGTFDDDRLASFIDAVSENNRDLKAAEGRIRVARANARIVGADVYPQINGNFDSQRSLQNFIGLPIPGAGPGGVLSNRVNQFGLSLNLSWEIDLWGKIRAAKKAAVADFEASEYDRATAELSIAGQAAKAWFALAEAKDQVALTRSTIATYSRTEDLLRNRFEEGVQENGRNFASELLLAEADVARARENLQSQIELAQRTSRQLEVLAGRYPAGEAGQEATLPPYPGTVPANLPATLLDRRPDLAASERRLSAADQRLLEAKRALLPTIGLTGNYGTTTPEIRNLLDGTFSVWSIASNVAQPILQGGRLRANVKRRAAEIDIAAAEFEQAALTAFAEVENALAAEIFLTERVAALIESSRLTRAAYERSRDEFVNGTGDILTVLSAQQRRFADQSQLLAVRRLRLQNRVDLYLALGGDFTPCPCPPEKNPEPPPNP